VGEHQRHGERADEVVELANKPASSKAMKLSRKQ